MDFIVFSKKQDLEKLDERMDCYLIPFMLVNLKWIEYLNLKTKLIKFPENTQKKTFKTSIP